MWSLHAVATLRMKNFSRLAQPISFWRKSRCHQKGYTLHVFCFRPYSQAIMYGIGQTVWRELWGTAVQGRLMTDTILLLDWNHRRVYLNSRQYFIKTISGWLLNKKKQTNKKHMYCTVQRVLFTRTDSPALEWLVCSTSIKLLCSLVLDTLAILTLLSGCVALESWNVIAGYEDQ